MASLFYDTSFLIIVVIKTADWYRLRVCNFCKSSKLKIKKLPERPMSGSRLKNWASVTIAFGQTTISPLGGYKLSRPAHRFHIPVFLSTQRYGRGWNKPRGIAAPRRNARAMGLYWPQNFIMLIPPMYFNKETPSG